MSLGTDNADYSVLISACKKAREIEGLSCEIGVRAGGSSKIISDILKEGEGRVMHVAVDPYGQIPHNSNDTEIHHTDSYNNRMKLTFLNDFSKYALENDFDFVFFQLGDDEFMSRFSNGVPIYDINKTLINSYRLVFLDGPHDTESVVSEAGFFGDRVAPGGVVAIDNIRNHDHSKVANALTIRGFIRLAGNRDQVAYIKRSDNPQNKTNRL